jgi:hypothetical protein
MAEPLKVLAVNQNGAPVIQWDFNYATVGLSSVAVIRNNCVRSHRKPSLLFNY